MALLVRFGRIWELVHIIKRVLQVPKSARLIPDLRLDIYCGVVSDSSRIKIDFIRQKLTQRTEPQSSCFPLANLSKLYSVESVSYVS